MNAIDKQLLLELLYKVYLESGYKVSTDTRSIQTGSVFFCLRGANFNGNYFAEQALLKGAGLVVMDDPDLLLKNNSKVVLVDDALQTLQDLALHHRKKLNIPIIAIAGSNGKTSTKELVSAVLRQKFSTHATKGNLNNHIGVPLTLLDITDETEMAVVELGTNAPGEIEVLCTLSLPDYGLITNIGKEHLEGFGTLEAVALEESMLYLHLQKHMGHAFVNADDPWLTRMASRLSRVSHYGKVMTLNDITYTTELKESVPRLRFTLNQISCKTHLFGDYNLSNILAAVHIGLFFEVGLQHIIEAVEAYFPANQRSQIIEENSLQLIVDCYNANPSSMEPALRNLAAISGRKRIAILGDMFELGEHAVSEHKSIAQLASELNLDQIILVGPLFQQQAPNIGVIGFDQTLSLLSDLQSIVDTSAPCTILLKASRGMKLEMLIDSILALNKR